MSADTTGTEPTVRSRRLEDHSVTYKQVMYALPFIAAALVTFGSWVLGQSNKSAEANAIAINALKASQDKAIEGLKDDIRRRDDAMARQVAESEARMTARLERSELKLDRVLDRLIDSGALPRPVPSTKVRR